MNKELVCYRVDGGLISSKDVSKCDFGIYSEDDLLLLVELKGADYNKALEQLLSTIDILLRNPSIPVSKVCTRVVLSWARVPDVLVTKEKKLKLMIKREYRGNHSKCSKQWMKPCQICKVWGSIFDTNLCVNTFQLPAASVINSLIYSIPRNALAFLAGDVCLWL